MQPLSGLDAFFLYAETESMHLHVALTAILDPSGAPEPLTLERLKALVAERLPLVPPFTRRLNEVPLTIDPQPRRKVKAWVRFGDAPVRVDAVAARWTPDAVGIVFHIDDVEHRCWVWAGAVDGVTA